jgi:flagellar basal-body rod protein FlgF
MKIKFFIFALLLIINSNAFATNNISYVVASRQADLFNTQDRLADMIANVNTNSFKKETNNYGELPVQVDHNKRVSFSQISSTKRDPSQGGINTTSRQLDAAIAGPGYFMVETPRGNRYTRGGNFQISRDGQLVTNEGYVVKGAGGGQVEFAEQDIDIKITEDGLVTANGEERGQIGIFVFQNEQGLIREGQGFYKSSETPTPGVDSKIVQGALETSNVNSVTAMTELMEVSRQIEVIRKMQADYHDSQINVIRTLSRE